MANNTKNYLDDGGDKLVIGGTLAIDADATVTGLAQQPLNAATASVLGGVKVGSGLSVTADGTLSTAMTAAENVAEAGESVTTVAGLAAIVNDLIGKLIDAGLMEEA